MVFIDRLYCSPIMVTLDRWSLCRGGLYRHAGSTVVQQWSFGTGGLYRHVPLWIDSDHLGQVVFIDMFPCGLIVTT